MPHGTDVIPLTGGTDMLRGSATSTGGLRHGSFPGEGNEYWLHR